VQAQTIKLPKECQLILDKNFQGWKLANISGEIKKFYKENNLPFEPNLVKGDWNGDGKIDYAVLIERNKNRQTIAFLRSGAGYKSFAQSGGDYISLIKKGEEGYNFDTQKKFIFRNDAISANWYGQAGVSFVWRANKFVKIQISD
jgi:hypothetical protein